MHMAGSLLASPVLCISSRIVRNRLLVFAASQNWEKVVKPKNEDTRSRMTF